MNCSHSLGVWPPPPSKKSFGIIFKRAAWSFLFTAALNSRQKAGQLRLAAAFVAADVCASAAQGTDNTSSTESIHILLFIATPDWTGSVGSIFDQVPYRLCSTFSSNERRSNSRLNTSSTLSLK